MYLYVCMYIYLSVCLYTYVCVSLRIYIYIYIYRVNDEIIRRTINIEYLTHFLKCNTRTMPDFLYIVKYKLNFEKGF